MSVSRAVALAVVVLAMCHTASRAEAKCSVSTAGVAFGRYNVFSATALASTGTISLDCGAADRNVRIHLSTGNSGTYMPREMRGPGGDVLPYNLFLDAAFTQSWGDGTGGTSAYSNSKPGKDVIHLTVFGRVTARQDVRAGEYGDTVVAEVNF